MVAAGLMSWMLTWWASPIDTLNANRFGYAGLRYALHRADRLRGVRLRRGRDGRRALAPNPPGHGHHAGRIRRGRAFPFAMYVRPHLLPPLKLVSTFDAAGGGYGFERDAQRTAILGDGDSNRPNSLVVQRGRRGQARRAR